MNAGRNGFPFWIVPVAAAVAAAAWWWQSNPAGERTPAASMPPGSPESPAVRTNATPPPQRPVAAAEEPPAFAADERDGDDGEAVRELADENERLRRHIDDLLEWIVNNLGGRFPVPEPMLAHLRVQAMDDGYRLHPDLVNMLRIAPREEARINEALARAARLAELIEAHTARVEWRSETEAVLHLPGDPVQGEAIRIDLRESFDDTLGADRGARLWTVAESSLAETFGAFGAADRVIIFSLEPSADGAADQLWIRDERRLHGAPDEPVRITAVEWLADDPPPAYARHIRLLTGAEEGDSIE